MKKALLIVVALVLITGVAFAQDAPGVKIGAWGRAIFAPVVAGGDDILSALGTSWSANTPRIGWTIAGSSANVGFQVDLNVDGIFNPIVTDITSTVVTVASRVTPGDQQKIWIKPIPQLQLQVGNIYDDTLRGSVGFGSYDWIRLTWTGDDKVFKRVIAQGNGFEASVTPVDGAYAYAGFSGLVAQPVLNDLLSVGQYGAGYTIPNIGVIRAQYIGESADLGTINAAFKLTAVPGLMADVGAFIPTDSDLAGKTADIGLIVTYGMNTMNVKAMAAITLTDADPSMEFGLGADYGLDGGITVLADLRYQNDIASGNPDGSIGFLIGATMGFSNGVIGIGLEGSTTNFAPGYLPLKSSPDAMAIALPIRLEYWF